GHVRPGRESSQGHPAGGAEPAQVRGDDVPDVGESLIRSLVPHANELYQRSNKMVRSVKKHREPRNEKCCEPARTTSSRSATAGRCGSMASRSGTSPPTRRSRRW